MQPTQRYNNKYTVCETTLPWTVGLGFMHKVPAFYHAKGCQTFIFPQSLVMCFIKELLNTRTNKGEPSDATIVETSFDTTWCIYARFHGEFYCV